MHIENTEKKFVKEVLYKDATYLKDRVSIFEYAVSTQSIWQWTWQKCPIQKPSNILEVGVGYGTYWMENLKKLPQGCQLTLTDISPGMLIELQSAVDFSGHNMKTHVADVEQLPFADNSFDSAFAHFVLYYTQNPLNALKELKRVVKPGGVVSIFTLNCMSCQQMYRLAREIESGFPEKDMLLETFCENNAPEYIKTVFGDYAAYSYISDIVIPADASLQKTLSSMGTTYGVSVTDDMCFEYEEKVREYIHKHGTLKTMSEALLFLCRS